MSFDPVELASDIESSVVRDDSRKYYRVARPGKWYGGIASADCVGCCLHCIFCWSGAPRDDPESIGRFYSPEHIFEKLDKCARHFGYSQLRVSGNEPTIGKRHLFRLLELIEQTGYKFILETNGILLGYDKTYAQRLSKFGCLHVRVSIKGTDELEFSILTGAIPQAFELQLKALENLLDAGVSCHPAVMLSFSPPGGLEKLEARLKEIDERLSRFVEEEYVFLYPHVAERLQRANVKPRISYDPRKKPLELI